MAGMRAALLVIGLSVVATSARDASACSCAGPSETLFSPLRDHDAPLNAHVVVELPNASVQPVVRAHGGADVPFTRKAIGGGTWSSMVELVPAAPLAPKTRYEVGVVDPKAHPPITIFGSFTTGTAADTTAPKLASLGPVLARKNARVMSGMCFASGPWLTLDGVAVSDPGRADARLSLLVWQGDANGRVDDTKPPLAIVAVADKHAQVGSGSICDSRRLALPEKGAVVFGFAATDEAGNRSATQKVRVDLGSATP
jgi:hypothetical protein